MLRLLKQFRRASPIIRLCGLCFFILSTGYSQTSTAAPGWISGTAPMVSPAEASAHVRTASAGSAIPKSLVTTPEITELAQALQCDTKRIYAHVRNHINYEPYFGLLKGPALTELNGAGNDFDQAALMVALLHECAISAGFVHGTMTIPLADVANWLGVAADTNPVDNVVGRVIASGGIPVTLNGGQEIQVVMDRIWVKAIIGGQEYHFDPAFKQYTEIANIDIPTALGYNRNTLLSSASNGATITPNSVQYLNEAGLANTLRDYAAKLIDTIRTQYPNSTVETILGGRQIIQEAQTTLPTALPYPTAISASWDDIDQNIAATYGHKLNINYQGINQDIYTYTLAGKRLTLTYNGNTQPELRLDGALLATGNPTTIGQAYTVSINIDHSYAVTNYMDQNAAYPVISGSTYAVTYNFGGSFSRLIKHRQATLDRTLAGGFAPESEAVRGESLHLMGLTWMHQTMLAEKIIGQLADTTQIRHHRIGLVGQESGYYIDVKQGAVSILPRQHDGETASAFIASGLIGSALEHGMLEQMQGSSNPGVSTIKLLQIANANGWPLYAANASNFASIRPQLQGYATSTLDSIQAQTNNGVAFILPESGQLPLGQWTGAGFISYTNNGGGSSIGMIIGGGYNGGFGSNPQIIDPGAINQTIQSNLPDLSVDTSTATPTSIEPVDMASGVYLYDHADLAISGPTPLTFARSYNSSRQWHDRGMGYGWRHGYDITQNKSSDGAPGLGTRLPEDSAAAIAALYVAIDLLRNQDDIQTWTTSALATKWAMDRLIDNVLNIDAGGRSIRFIKRADGGYQPPPGETAQLVANSDGTFNLQQRFGNRVEFNSAGQAVRQVDADGNTLTFTYSGGKLSQVTSSFGQSLTLTYIGNHLDSVSDSSGRSVEYRYDGSDDLTDFIDTAGKNWRYGYDSAHRFTTLTNPLLIQLVANGYDALGRVKTQTVPRESGPEIYNFFFSGFRNIEQDPLGG